MVKTKEEIIMLESGLLTEEVLRNIYIINLLGDLEEFLVLSNTIDLLKNDTERFFDDGIDWELLIALGRKVDIIEKAEKFDEDTIKILEEGLI